MRGCEMDISHNETIQKEFTKQARGYGKQGITLVRQDYLKWMVDHLPLEQNFRVLDVAAGTGHFSRAIALYVHKVVAIDTTFEMLKEGRKEVERVGIANIIFAKALAETLPFPDNFFDVVVCRLAIHHFQEPILQVREMYRVCKKDGVLGIIDLIAPSDREFTGRYNRLERLRDPSHTVALSKEELAQLANNSGMVISHTDECEIEVNVDHWFELTKTNKRIRNKIKEQLVDEINGGTKTGMRPFIQNNEVMFLQTWVIVVSKK